MHEILTALDGLLPGLHDCAAEAVHGHVDHWPGPLDPQSLATSSVGLAAAAAQECARSAGRGNQTITAHLPEVIAAFGSIGRLRIDGRPLPGFAPASGFFRTADGWVRTHANYPHHRARLLHALGIHDDDALAPALARLTSLDAESRITVAGGVAARVSTEEQWRRESTQPPGPWINLRPGAVNDRGTRSARRRGPWPAPAPSHSTGPLHGVRVVSLTRVIAGPTAAKFLAALGATVLRIDPPHMPELLGQHLDTDLGVRCATRHLRSSRHAQELTEALSSADVLLTGYRPGSLTNLGLDADSVTDRLPHLVHVELSAWEPRGSRTGLRGFDSIVQAATGIAHRSGGPDEHGTWRPGALPVQALDHATGYGMAAAACALLATGTAGHARLSLERTARVLLEAGSPPHQGPAPVSTSTADLEGCEVTLETCEGTVRCIPSPVRVDGRRPPVLPPLRW